MKETKFYCDVCQKEQRQFDMKPITFVIDKGLQDMEACKECCDRLKKSLRLK